MAKAPRPTGAGLFRATILLAGETATGIHVPDDAVRALGRSRHLRVRATINGRHVSQHRRDAAGGAQLRRSIRGRPRGR